MQIRHQKYQIEKNEYNKLIIEAITSTYKKILDKISNKFNASGKIIENKEVVNRTFMRNSYFITLKIHKQNFLENLNVCLLHPAKK